MAGLSADAKIVFIFLFAAVKIFAIAAQTTASVETTPDQQGTSNPATTATTPVQPQTTQNAETTQPQQQTTNLPTASPSTEVPANTGKICVVPYADICVGLYSYV